MMQQHNPFLPLDLCGNHGLMVNVRTLRAFSLLGVAPALHKSNPVALTAKGANAFEKKLQALFVPSPSFCAKHKALNCANSTPGFRSNYAEQGPNQQGLKKSNIVLLLLKASQQAPAKFDQPNACLNFNLQQNQQLMLHYTGKTHFSKNFVNHFYANDATLLCQLTKPTGAGIDVFRYESTWLEAAPDNGFNGRVSKAQLSSIAGQVFLNHLLLAHTVGQTAVKKQTKLTKADVLETTKVVLGAFIMLDHNVWFISANELTQCCFMIIHTKLSTKQPCLQLRAAPVGLLQGLKKATGACVNICSHALTRLCAIISHRLRHATAGQPCSA